MFKKNREIKECLRSFSASQSCLSWWKASLMWWVIKMMSNSQKFIDFAELVFHVIIHHQPGHPGGAWTSEEVDIVRRKVWLFSFPHWGYVSHIRDILFGPSNESLLKGAGVAEPEELQLEAPKRSFCTGGNILWMAGAELSRCWIILRNI